MADAWTYANFVDPSGSVVVATLVLHMAEVRQKIGPSVGADGKNVQREGMITYLESLQKQLDKARGGGGKMSVASFVSAR